MPNITFNDQKLSIEPKQSLEDLLKQKQGRSTADNPFAVALNQQFVPCQDWGCTILKENDRVDIIGPQQGG